MIQETLSGWKDTDNLFALKKKVKMKRWPTDDLKLNANSSTLFYGGQKQYGQSANVCLCLYIVNVLIVWFTSQYRTCKWRDSAARKH